MKLCADANHLGISSETAWRRWQRGELPAQQVPSGTVMVEVPPLAQGARPQQVAVYARVSSAETRKHLDRQAERVVACCLAGGWPVAGPWRREATNAAAAALTNARSSWRCWPIPAAATWLWSIRTVARCSRCGVASLQTVRKTQSRELVIVNAAAEEPADLMLLQDVVGLITSFCARLSGRRRASRKKPQGRAALEEDGYGRLRTDTDCY